MPKRAEQDMTEQIEAIDLDKPKQRLRRTYNKPAQDKWDHNKVRVGWVIDKSLKDEATLICQNGGSPGRYLGGTVEMILANWVDGHYDDVHRDLGWPKRPEID